MLHDTIRTLQEISRACVFHSVNSFRRQFRKHYGYASSRANEGLKLAALKGNYHDRTAELP